MTLRIGIVGCGNISDIYLTNLPRFRGTAVTAVADLKPEAARAQGEKHGVRAVPVDDIFKRDDVDLILNLTVPAAHAEVSLRAIEAGKHVYGEKPLATSLADGRAIVAAAAAKGLRVGSAPDTILGAGVQRARRLFDDGAIGSVVTGTATVLGRGMEHWHPNPEFFFKPGGGPVLDMGPYYIATLVTLLGPIKSIRATGQIGRRERLVTSEGPMRGQTISVETLTTVNALYHFENGADVVFLASWDVWAHGQLPIELHGTRASIRVPDPNFFGGVISVAEPAGDWTAIDVGGETLGRVNWPAAEPRLANYRGVGIADLAAGLREGRPHRASGDLALHTLAVMLGTLEAATEGRVVEVAETCVQPAVLTEEDAAALWPG
ncbi:Gfo/Idh/MocA family protein [Chthonobacter albigriseus]|uniref:Gfo/Idh/MocA family protein n=1 Tax=Chthonobacter albigriseus TaxID=1683161 RepID=UPI0015EFAC6D|nr:Gfo/Idh/MocA family oxidoreductase [Chthonobacter albigriseus]